MQQQGVLIVFARSPIAGKVKTRLIPDIGTKKAARLYEKLLNHTMTQAVQSDFREIQLWLDGDSSHPLINSIIQHPRIKLFEQQGDSLGSRMDFAFHQVLKEFSYAIIIGADCPNISFDDLNQAAEILKKDVDVLLGPAEDGGYYLIGLKKTASQLFTDISWGSEKVLTQTLDRIDELGLKNTLLKKNWDLDRVADLRRYLFS